MSTENIQDAASIRLTQFSRGAGCGCKIAPSVLEEILRTEQTAKPFSALLVGNQSNDDAAVYDLGNGSAIISTTDFFMPIVDDAFDFGRIASANAISDVYAMGGKPLMAVAVLGWPIDKIPVSLAQQVLEGARNTCADANIPLAGGHSIDAAEPIFGLAVTGLVDVSLLKKNNTATEGDLIYLTKPIGVGILSTAIKRGLIQPEHEAVAIESMCQLNKAGESLGRIAGVTAMTDVTGFGILGHLVEMASGAGLGAEIFYQDIPVAPGAREYLAQRVVPDATFRNWNSYSSKVGFEKGVPVMEAFSLLPDPQTNGGLLFTVKPGQEEAVEACLQAEGPGTFAKPIGRMVAASDKIISVRNGSFS